MTQLKSLQKKRNKQKLAVDKLSKSHLLDASVVLGTLVGCKERGPLNLLPEDHFQTCVIDECGQSLEMACWIVIPRASRLILAGDHHQLPPTVITKNPEAAKKLSVSLMERLRDRFFYGKDAVFHMLNVRMDKFCIFKNVNLHSLDPVPDEREDNGLVLQELLPSVPLRSREC